MKIGTFWCWLFGHKFIGEDWRVDYVKRHKQTDVYQLPFCIRCGIDKPNETK